MDPILEEAGAFGLPVVEDATESLGVRYKGRHPGSFGRMACLSFNGNKILTTGGGGMLVTDDPDLARRARHLTTQAKDDIVEYIHGEVGFNYRLSNVLAAIGVAQMEQLESHVADKRATAKAYTKALSRIPGIRCLEEPEGAFSTFWLYSILVDEKDAGMSSRALLRHLDGNGIQTRPLWQPMHLSPAHRGSYATDCSVAERLNRQAISLPCSVGIKEEERTRVVKSVRAALNQIVPG
jgi:perosamine synthetase